MEQACMRVGSERHHFMMYWNVEQYEDGIKYVFCDELVEYMFYPYSGALKEVPSYCENKAAFEEIRIFLIIKSTGKLVKVPCYIVEESKRVYIEEKNFNKYWKLIHKNICKGINKKQADKEVAHASVNEMVDLSLLESHSRIVEISEAFTIVYKGRAIDIETQRLVSKRACAMDDNGIGYVYARSERFVHDKTCRLVEGIAYWDFEATEELPEDRELCPDCKKRIFIRNAMKTDKKRFAWYLRFFENGRVNAQAIENFLRNKDVALYMESMDELIVKYEEDMWRIKLTSQGTYRLYHNNYVITGDGERYITTGFHDQKHHPQQLSGILHYIEGYDWHVHLKDKKCEVDVEENVAEMVVVVPEDVTEGETTVSISLWKRIKGVLWRIFEGNIQY